MATPAAIGKHRVSRTGDVVGMRFDGPITRDDIVAMRAMMSELIDEHGSAFLVSDMSGCTGIEAGARKQMAQWSKERTVQVNGTAVYGVNFAMRTLLTLTLNAIKFIGAQQVEVMFVKDENEARQYVERRRAELSVGDGKHGAR